MIRHLAAFAALPLAACAVGPQSGPASPYEVQQRMQQEAVATTAVDANPESTDISDQAALDRLRNNSGITLQWIGWDRRGQLEVSQLGQIVYLTGNQSGSGDDPACSPWTAR